MGKPCGRWAEQGRHNREGEYLHAAKKASRPRVLAFQGPPQRQHLQPFGTMLIIITIASVVAGAMAILGAVVLFVAMLLLAVRLFYG